MNKKMVVAVGMALSLSAGSLMAQDKMEESINLRMADSIGNLSLVKKQVSLAPKAQEE